MNWPFLIIAAVIAAAALTFSTYFLSKYLQARDPYAGVLSLTTRQKLRFFKLMATDSNVPKTVKFVPVLLWLYLAMPFDIIPDFIPVLGYIDDVAVIVIALVLMIKFTPHETVLSITERVKNAEHRSGS